MGALPEIRLGVVADFLPVILYGGRAQVVYRYSAPVQNASEERRAAAARTGHGR
jgi:hypothetical protein